MNPEKNKSDLSAAHLFYSGAVQGVGFRYTAHSYAVSLDLKGLVRNLPDGRVEFRLEGPRDNIEEFCRRIEAHFEGYIREKDIQWTPAQGNLTDFRIVV